MTDELREAAERMDEYEKSSVTAIGRDTYHGTEHSLFRDAIVLSRAYRDEHPSDDDTPIDEAWLLKVGADWYEPDACWLFEGPPDITAWISSRDDNQWEWHACDVLVPTCRTRGQLRRLCSALGIELKEGS